MFRFFRDTFQIIFLIEVLMHVSCVELNVNPQDAKIILGNTGQFMCVVAGLGDNQIVKWFRDHKMIAKDTRVISSYASSIEIDTDETLGHHNLVIAAVKKSDNGSKYYCSVYEDGIEKLKSDEALLIVNEIPNLEYNPSCKGSDKQFYENKPARFSCTSDKGYPTVQLKWYYGSEKLPNQESNIGLNKVTAETSLFITKQHKEAVFVCSLTTEADAEERKNCTIGPIRVQYKPTTEIQGLDVINAGSDGVYVCYSDAIPEVKEYKWTLPNNLSPEKYKYENDRQVLRLSGLTINDNGTYIECTTHNSQGTGVGKFIVKVNPHNIYLNNGGNENVEIPAGSSSVNLDKKTNSSTAAMLSVVGGSLLFLASIMAFLLCSVILYTRRQTGLYAGNHIPQPDVYYVPKDSIDASSGSTYQTGKWKRSIATQVPNDLELESITYAEIEEGKKLINNYRSLKNTKILKEDAK